MSISVWSGTSRTKNLRSKQVKKSKDLPFLIDALMLAYEVKVNNGIFKYQKMVKPKVKLISQFRRFILFFDDLKVS